MSDYITIFLNKILGEPHYLRYSDDTPIKVNVAPEPSDIIWENLEYSWWYKFRSRILSLLLSILLLGCSVFLILFLNRAKDKIDDSNHKNKNILTTFFSISVCLVIIIINYLLERLIKLFTKFEK